MWCALRGVTPGGAQSFAVAEPEDRGDDNEDDLVERAWHWREPDCGEAAEPTGEPAVAGEQADRSGCSFHVLHWHPH